ncbi:hypothetical protein CA234_11125 [Sphingomonas sp. ABOLE]|uniref:hypothetical protein n=1 Tax=Sphingomonas sp. ABOLE TaxID=1985878 RepID=UPI000F7F1C73|nr:hypothetical protein [Sphingomonas sp. ABOLE]RSV40653.1 hypothetical protein CA234_11125 [Sphingomonas sp. ABOLE]
MTAISWFARIVTSDGNPLIGQIVQLQLFDMKSGWRSIADATTASDGSVKGRADDGMADAKLAPMLRLVDVEAASAVLGGVPQLTASANEGTLTADFGEIVRIEQQAHFQLGRVAPKRLGRDTATIGGVAIPAAARVAVGARLAGVDGDTVGAATAATAATRIDADALVTRATVAERLATERERDLAALRGERDDVIARLADSENQLAALRAAAAAGAAGKSTDTIGLASSVISIGDFATQVGREIDGAQIALRTRGFSLGTISVNARALVDQGGKGITFPGQEDLKTVGGGLTDIGLQFNPSPVTETSGVQIPDIRQLTESAARRVLASVGLALDAHHGPPQINPDCAEGQAMLQAPKAGDSAARGSTVMAIFARSTT